MKARWDADCGGHGHQSCPPLTRFRAELYQTGFWLRRDALYKVLEAVLCGERSGCLVRRSLCLVFHRRSLSVLDVLVPALLRRRARLPLP